jgi:hypothetical protein
MYGEIDQEVKLNDEGEAVIVWREDRRDGECLLATTRSCCGEWSPPVTLAAQADLNGYHFDLTASGRISLIWKEYTKGGEYLYRSLTKELSDDWPAPVTLTKALDVPCFVDKTFAFVSDGSLLQIGVSGPTIPYWPILEVSRHLLPPPDFSHLDGHGSPLYSAGCCTLQPLGEEDHLDLDLKISSYPTLGNVDNGLFTEILPESSTQSEADISSQEAADCNDSFESNNTNGEGPKIEVARYSDGYMESVEILKETQCERASPLAICMAADTGICVWREENSSSDEGMPIYASWYSNGEWLHSQEICTAHYSTFSEPFIHIDSIGNGVVVIPTNNGYTFCTSVNSNWSKITLPVTGRRPQFACNRHGDILTILIDTNGPSQAIGFCKKVASNTFDPIVIPKTLDWPGEYTIQVDNSENFIVVWMEGRGLRGTIFGAVFSPKSGELSEVTPLLYPTNDRSSYISPSFAWSKAKGRGIISYIFTNGLDAELQVVDLFAD